jgi:uncharacterized membrane protein
MNAFEMTGRDDARGGVSQKLRSQTSPAGETNVGPIGRWGAIISGVALAAYGLKRRSLGGAALSLAGAGLVYRGLTGYCQIYHALGINTSRKSGATEGIEVEKAMTIEKSPEEVYRFWRRFENLPRFMTHLKSVQSMDHRRSHWVAKAPLGMTVEWDAEITDERENELIAWRAVEGARIPNNGSVRFQRAPGGRGTEVRVSLAYTPPMGKLGATFAKLFGEEPGQQLSEDLRRLKWLMETGEIPTTEGQASGRVRTRGAELARQSQRSRAPSSTGDVVEKASMESFRASDARLGH